MDIAPQVKDATEAIQHLPPLLNAISSLFQRPVGWALLAALFVWLLLNKDFSKFFDFFERKEKRRSEHLDLYVSKSELADEESIRVLRDLRDAEYFKIATGIYAEKRLRRALIGLHERTSHHTTWGHIRRAIQFLEADKQGNVSVRDFTRFETIGYWYNQIIGYASLLLAAGIISLLLLSYIKGPSAVAISIGGSFAIILFAMFAFAQNWPVQAAKRIKAEISEENPHVPPSA